MNDYSQQQAVKDQDVATNLISEKPLLYRTGMILLVMLVIWFVQTKEGQNSWNDASRLATIESLLERGTWQIDESPFAQVTWDKVFLNNHFYSSKPPLFEAAAVIPYSLMYYLLDVKLQVEPCRAGEICAYKWLTFIMVGIPSAIMIALLYWSISRQLNSNGWALFMAGLFSFGTMVWPYSLVFSNHIPAAACLLASFLIILSARQSLPNNRYKLFWAGLLASLAAAIDLTAVFMALALFAIVIFYHKRASLPLINPVMVFFVLGGALPALLTIFFDYQISGSVFPAYFFREGYNYPGSPWLTRDVGATSASENILDATVIGLVGERGLFSHSPVLLWPLFGLISVLRHRKHAFWPETVFLAAGMMIYTLFLITRTEGFGGNSYGFRYIVPIIPFIAYFTMFAPLKSSSLKKRLAFVSILGVALALSLHSTYRGAVNPWSRVQPLLFLRTREYAPYVDACSSLDKRFCLDLMLNPCGQAALGKVERQFELPQEMQYTLQANFSNKIMLVGYDLGKRSLKAGEALPVVVYWQSLGETNQNYIQFNRLLDSQLRQHGGYDRKPRETYITSCWQRGEIVADGYTLPIDANAPDGVYYLYTGLYPDSNGNFAPLHLVQNGQLIEGTSVRLGPIKVGGPPPGVTVTKVQPEHSLQVNFGDIISLKGYDLAQQQSTVQLKLYWQSLAQTEVDYTVFVHLLNPAGDIVTQVDGPPAQGAYPTSLWAAGEVIRDELILSLPRDMPAGRYTVIVGLYDFATGARLKVQGSNDSSASLMTFGVEPK